MDTAEFDQSIDESGKGVESAFQGMQGHLRATGIAFTAVGAAGLKLAADARKLNASLGQVGLTIGASTAEMRNLALATTNVTFKLESVTATFDILSRAGIHNIEVMQDMATTFDTLGDAIGMSAEEVAGILIPAFKALGEELPASTADLDKFTWLVKNTTIDLTEFGSVMDYVAMYGSALSVSLDEMVAIMAVLESRGMSGATATRLFRTAVSQASDGAVTLTEALDITQSEIEVFIEEMEGATGITDEYAAVANTQYSIMDRLKQKWSELTLVAGTFLTPLEPILGLMTALGPLMIFFSTSMGIATAKTIAHTVALIALHPVQAAHLVITKAVTAAQWLWNTALSANPIGLVIVAIGALVAALVALKDHLGQFISWATPAFEELGQGIEGYMEKLQVYGEDVAADVESATQNAIQSVQTVADAERQALSQRIEWYRDFHYERMDYINEQMLAEIRAIDPVLAAQLEQVNQEMALLDERAEAREEEREQERVRNLQEQLEQDGLTESQRDALERELEVIEDARLREQLINERNQQIQELDMASHLEQQQTELDTALNEQISRYETDLEAFEAMNATKLGNLEAFVEEYNRIMSGLGATPGVEGFLSLAPKEPSTFSREIPLWQHGGVIREPTLLTGLRSRVSYAIAGGAGPEPVGPVSGEYRSVNVIVQLDERTLVQALGQPMVDEIRLRQGLRI